MMFVFDLFDPPDDKAFSYIVVAAIFLGYKDKTLVRRGSRIGKHEKIVRNFDKVFRQLLLDNF